MLLGISFKIQFTPLFIWYTRPTDIPNHQLGVTWLIAESLKLTEDLKQQLATTQNFLIFPASLASLILVIWWPIYLFSLWFGFLSNFSLGGSLCNISISCKSALYSLVSISTLETDGILFQGDFRILPVNRLRLGSSNWFFISSAWVIESLFIVN